MNVLRKDLISNLLLFLVSASTEVSRCSCDQATTIISIWCSSVSHQWPQRSSWKRGLLLHDLWLAGWTDLYLFWRAKGFQHL